MAIVIRMVANQVSRVLKEDSGCEERPPSKEDKHIVEKYNTQHVLVYPAFFFIVVREVVEVVKNESM